MKPTTPVLVLAVLFAAVGAAASQEVKPVPKPARVCAVSLSWAGKDRNLKHVLDMLDQAAAQRADIVCLPQECVPTDGGDAARAALEAIAKKAAAHKMFVAANLRQYEAGRHYLTSYLIGPDGKTAGTYRKSHGVTVAAAHLPMSEASQRSYVIDPYGYIQAASQYWRDSVCTAEVDLDAGRTRFARTDKPGTAGQKGYMAGYYPKTIPEKRTDFRDVLLAGRRPELYQAIPENTLADRQISEEVFEKMTEPRR